MTGNNMILFEDAGVGGPTAGSRSQGTKLVLPPTPENEGNADFAIGIDANTMWSSVYATSGQFQWFAGTS